MVNAFSGYARMLPESTHRFHLATYESSDRLVIYTDGSCLGNGGSDPKAGIGFYIPDTDYCLSAPLEAGLQTNQRAELKAVFMALFEVSHLRRDVEIRTDSHYAINGLTEWSINWERKGWEVSVQNKDLFQSILRLSDTYRMKVFMKYVAGHSQDRGNDMADALAQQGARSRSTWKGYSSQFRSHRN